MTAYLLRNAQGSWPLKRVLQEAPNIDKQAGSNLLVRLLLMMKFLNAVILSLIFTSSSCYCGGVQSKTKQRERTRVSVHNSQKLQSFKGVHHYEPIRKVVINDVKEDRPVKASANVGRIEAHIGDILNDLNCSLQLADIHADFDKITIQPTTEEMEVQILVQCDIAKNAQRFLEYLNGDGIDSDEKKIDSTNNQEEKVKLIHASQ